MMPPLAFVGLLLVLSPVVRVSGEVSSDTAPQRVQGDGWGAWSDWGPCSQPCDGGVTKQTRSCLREQGCPGLAVRREMCNMLVCVNITDPRMAQCAAYDSQPHTDGRTYAWEPYPDLSDPCALTCRARGQKLVAKLASKVIDGTRCREGSLDICIDGHCETLGCDLKIGSDRTVDICGVCGGDGGGCGSGDHFWVEKVIAPCSVSCGGGFQVGRPVCRSRRSGVDVSDEFCDFRLRPRDRLMECGLLPCLASWTTDAWGECSASCDGGHKRRKVWCAEMANNTLVEVPESRCTTERPTGREPCNFVACPKWYQGPWSQCSVTCGDSGEQTRAVFCRDARGHLSDACAPELKPAGRQSCPSLMACPLSQVKPIQELPHQLPLSHAQPLFPAAVESSRDLTPSTDPKFVADSWSGCSVTCGEGFRRRKVECKVYLEFSQTMVTLPNRECGRHPPADLERCILPICPSRHSMVNGVYSGQTAEADVMAADSGGFHQPFRQAHSEDRSEKQPRHIYDNLYDVNDPPDHVLSPELTLNGAEDADDDAEYSSPERYGGAGSDHLFDGPEVTLHGDNGIYDGMGGDYGRFASPEDFGAYGGHHHADGFSSPERNPLGADAFSSPEVSPLGPTNGNVAGGDGNVIHHHDEGSHGIHTARLGDEAFSSSESGVRLPHVSEDMFSSPERPEPAHRTEGIHRLRSAVLRDGRTYPDVAGAFDLLGGRSKPNNRGRHAVEGGVVVIRPTSPGPLPPPPQAPEYVWKKVGFTPCSSSCLGGVQESIVQCIHTPDGSEASPFKCSLDTRPDSITRTCNDVPCPPRWNVTEFSACSHDCGKGLQHREVNCIHELARGEDNTLVVEDQQCSSPRPADKQLCNMVDCPPRWTPGEWSQCSRSCGGGIKHRVLRCQQRMADGTVVDKAPSMCGTSRPADRRACNKRNCQGPQVISSDQRVCPPLLQSYEQETIQKRVTLKIGGTASVFKGTTVKLKCPVRQFDRTKIVWTKDGVRLTGSHKHRLKRNGQVAVHQVEYRDSGRYTCIAGAAMGSLDLSVKPSPMGELPWIKERRLRKERKKKLREERRRKKQRRRKQKMAAASTARPRHWNSRHRGDEMSNTIDETPAKPQPQDKVLSPDGDPSNSLDDLRGKFVSDQQSPDNDLPKGLVLGSNRGRHRSRFGRPKPTTSSTTTTAAPELQSSTARGAAIGNGTVSGDGRQTGGDAARPGENAPEPEEGSGTEDEVTEPTSRSSAAAAVPGEGADDGGEIEVLGKGDPSEVRFEWMITDWSPCSQTCGGHGFQLRATQCLVRLKNATKTVAAALCEDAGQASPRSVRPCGQIPCPAWHAGRWRPCEKSRCVQWNYAMQRRRVTCRFPNGTSVEPRLCPRRQRPASRQECYNDLCKGSWRVEPWAACLARCGAAGYQTRILRCVWYGTRKPAGNTCRDQPRPKVVKSCVGPPCPPLGTSSQSVPDLSHDGFTNGSGCRDRASYCDRARKLSLCSMQKIKSDCCRTCRDVG